VDAIGDLNIIFIMINRQNDKQLKFKLIKILIEIDRICDKHGLRYFLVGGSTIGAVRHNGFIPWDDDADVALPRNDFEKFKSIVQKELGTRYRFVDNKIDSNYYYRFAKVYDEQTTIVEKEYPFYIGGVWVDIFAIDGLPNNPKEREIHLRCYESFYYKLFELYDKEKFKWSLNPLYIYHYLRRIYYHKKYNFTYLISKCEEIAKMHAFEDSEYVINFGGGYGRKEITRHEFFDNYIKFPFEGHNLRIPVGYDGYLKGIYGDYMKYPPIEKRVTNHTHYFMNLDRKCVKREIVEFKNNLR
jgi:LPS biosynthesis protein